MEGVERVGKGEGGFDLDICPGAPEFLLTPVYLKHDGTEGTVNTDGTASELADRTDNTGVN